MYIVLADDLTGAMDTGIQFRKYGIQTSVIVSADDCELRGDSCAGAVSINNSSRELSGSEAYEKTLRAVHRLSLSPQDILYKKIDSMMRGNPVQEIDAALEASGCNRMFDVWMMMLFGVVAYVLEQLGVDMTPIILGFILGPMIEKYFRSAMIASSGMFLDVFTRPISCVFMIVAVTFLLLPLFKMLRCRQKARKG